MPKFILRERSIEGHVRTRYGSKMTFGPWRTLFAHETLEAALAAQREQRGLADRGVFHAGRRVTDNNLRVLDPTLLQSKA